MISMSKIQHRSSFKRICFFLFFCSTLHSKNANELCKLFEILSEFCLYNEEDFGLQSFDLNAHLQMYELSNAKIPKN